MVLKDLPRFCQPRGKAAIGQFVTMVQSLLPLEAEILASRVKPLDEAFGRMRDGMVSHSLKLIYFPLPKSACTLFATFVALNSEVGPMFDPQKEGVHQFRFRERALQLRNMALTKDADYFKFTVIRDPYSRLVSAYLDKLVKPISAGCSWATDARCGNHSFEQLVEALGSMRDARIEKHFRPQAAFIKNISMDHIGLFDDLGPTFRTIFNRYGIDIESDVVSRVRAPKRTNYEKDDPGAHQKGYVGNLTAREIASRDDFPAMENFYNERLRNIVAKRYHEDFEIYNHAKNINSGTKP